MSLQKEDIVNLANYLVTNHQEELRGQEGICGQDGTDNEARALLSQLKQEISSLRKEVYSNRARIELLKTETAELKQELAKKF